MNQQTSIEAAKAELERAQAALQAAKEAEREAMRVQEEAERKKKHEMAVTKWRDMLESVQKILKETHGIETTINEKGTDSGLCFNGDSHTNTRVRRYFDGKAQVQGPYGGNAPRPQSYPQKPDGSYNVDKIAQKLAEMWRCESRRREATIREDANYKASGAIRDRITAALLGGETHVSGLLMYASQSDPERVKIEFKGSFTEEEATRLIQALKDSGTLS